MAMIELWLQATLLCVMVIQAIKLLSGLPHDPWKRVLTSMDISWYWDGVSFLDDSESSQKERTARCICEATIPKFSHMFQEIPQVYRPMCQTNDQLDNMLACSGAIFRTIYHYVNVISQDWNYYILPAIGIIAVTFLIRKGIRRTRVGVRALHQVRKIVREILRHILASVALSCSFCNNVHMLESLSVGASTSSLLSKSAMAMKAPTIQLFMPKGNGPLMYNALYQLGLSFIFTALEGPKELPQKLMLVSTFFIPTVLSKMGIEQHILDTTPRLALVMPFIGIVWQVIGRRLIRTGMYVFETAKHVQRRGLTFAHTVFLAWALLAEWWVSAVMFPLLVLSPIVFLAGNILLSFWFMPLVRIIWTGKMAMVLNEALHQPEFSFQSLTDAATDGYISLLGTASFLAIASQLLYNSLEAILPSGRTTSIGDALAIQFVASVVSTGMMAMPLLGKRVIAIALLHSAMHVVLRELTWRSDLILMNRTEPNCPSWVYGGALVLSIIPWLAGYEHGSLVLSRISWVAMLLALLSPEWARTKAINMITAKVMLKGLLSAGALVGWGFFVLPWVETSAHIFAYGLMLCNDIDATATAINLRSKREMQRRVHDMFPNASAGDLAAHNDVCAICQDDMIEAKMTPCHHFFHEDCLQNAMLVQQHCPVCRGRLSTPRTVMDEVAGFVTIVGGEWNTNGRAFLNGTTAPIWPMSSWTLLVMSQIGGCRDVGEPLCRHLLHNINSLIDKRIDLLAEIAFPLDDEEEANPVELSESDSSD